MCPVHPDMDTTGEMKNVAYVLMVGKIFYSAHMVYPLIFLMLQKMRKIIIRIRTLLELKDQTL